MPYSISLDWLQLCRYFQPWYWPGILFILTTATLQPNTHLFCLVDTCRRWGKSLLSCTWPWMQSFLWVWYLYQAATVLATSSLIREPLFIKSCTLFFPFWALLSVEFMSCCQDEALPSFQYYNSDSTVVFISLKESPTFDLAKLQAPFLAQERPLAPSLHSPCILG